MNSLDLAVIGNCMISALVDRRAQIVWSCFPRFDGDPVFSALLDSPEGRSDAEQKGVFAIDMVGMVSCEQSYIENTAVLLSRMTDSFGNILEITDFAPRFKHYDRTFRPPHAGPPGPAGEGPSAHPRALTAPLRLGRAIAEPHPRQQPSALRRPGLFPAPDHRCLRLLRAGGAALRGRPADVVLLRRGRAASLRDRHDRPRASSTAPSISGATGCARSRSPSTGRRR